MHTSQSDYDNLKKSVEAMNHAKDNYRKSMQEVHTSTIYSESEKSRRMREIETVERKASSDALDSFLEQIETLKGHIKSDMTTWPNASNPALSVVMTMINMKQQPEDAMITPFIGDIITMNAISDLLQTADLRDVAKPYTLAELDLETITMRASTAMLNARGAYYGFVANNAGRIISKIAPITGHVMDMTPSDEEQVEAAFRGAGLAQ